MILNHSFLLIILQGKTANILYTTDGVYSLLSNQAKMVDCPKSPSFDLQTRNISGKPLWPYLAHCSQIKQPVTVFCLSLLKCYNFLVKMSINPSCIKQRIIFFIIKNKSAIYVTEILKFILKIAIQK